MGARIAEIAPQVLVEFARDGEGLEMFGDNGAGVVRGTCIFDADGISKGKS
jgi:hypothetical protein